MKKIMIVDDQEDFIFSIKISLEKTFGDKYQVIPAYSGRQCFDILTKQEMPDLILLDIMMPKMNGWEVCRRIRSIESMKELPIFVVTSLHGEADTAIAKNSGANEFLVKPIKSDDLVKRLRKYLGSPFKV